MNCLAPSVNKKLLVSRNSIREAQAKALDLFVGRGCRYSVKELSNATGVPDRCIEAAKCEPDDPDYRPLSQENLASIAKFLKAPFVSVYLEVSDLGAFELMDAQAPLPKVLTADSAKPAETPREKVERLQIELFRAVEELTA